MEKERLLLCLSRYDHYYATINNKNSVLLSLSIFLVGGLVAAYPSLLDKVTCTGWLHANMDVLLSLGLANLLLITTSSIPFLKKGGTSLLFFGSVASLSAPNFATQSAAETTESELTDLRNQVHALATGLHRKFTHLRLAGYLLLLQFILFIPLIIQIIQHLKH